MMTGKKKPEGITFRLFYRTMLTLLQMVGNNYFRDEQKTDHLPDLHYPKRNG
jgi:hypothetical protein